MRTLKKNKRGFTLVELIIVIAILAILAAIAVPNFIGLTNQATSAKNIGNATAIAAGVNAYNALHPTAMCTDKTGAKTKIGNLYPAGISATDDTAAPALITIDATSGYATVNNALPS